MGDAALHLEPYELREMGVDFNKAIREKRKKFPHIFVHDNELSPSNIIARNVTILSPTNVRNQTH